jgi:hypothetical protein
MTHHAVNVSKRPLSGFDYSEKVSISVDKLPEDSAEQDGCEGCPN